MHQIFIYARRKIIIKWQSKIAYQDPHDPSKFDAYMHYKIMDPVDPDPQFYFAF